MKISANKKIHILRPEIQLEYIGLRGFIAVIFVVIKFGIKILFHPAVIFKIGTGKPICKSRTNLVYIIIPKYILKRGFENDI